MTTISQPANVEATPSAPPRRRGERTLTIPEQIANHIAAAIVNGDYVDGERLLELELAALYGVSRGPVREAIRELEKHGLAVLHPRRGAYVIGVSLDLIAESFNIRAALAGVAARQFTRRRTPEHIAALAACIETLAAMAASDECGATDFARGIATCARAIYHHCGAGHLERMLREQVHASIWGLMWRAQPLDYLTRDRRNATVDYWTRMLAAIRRGNETLAERLFREEIQATRDSVLATLAATRGMVADPRLLIHDRVAAGAGPAR